MSAPTPDLQVKLAVYRWFAETGRRPSPEDVAERTGITPADVLESYQHLRAQRVLVLDEDGASIRMAPPFSGVQTQHAVMAAGVSYFANCAWDAFGIPAALRSPATVQSRCERSMEPLRLAIGLGGPEGEAAESGWLFHCAVPAAHWWDDIVFT
ncbi:MAG: organomercurial lyase [Thermoanaerobaculia bacterium]